MRTFRVFTREVTAYCFIVEAESEEQAEEQFLEDPPGNDTADVIFTESDITDIEELRQ